MKKLFSILLSIFFIAIIVSPIKISAQTASAPEFCDFFFHNDLKRLGSACSELDSCCTPDIANCQFCQFLDSIYTVTDWTSICLLSLTFLILAVWIIFDLFKNKTKIKNIFFKKKIIFAIIGISLAALVRWAVPFIVKAIV